MLFLLTALHCLAFVDRTMIGGALPLLREGVAMTDTQAGWLVGTAVALPYGAAALALAALGRGRPASTRWLLAGVLIWTAGSLMTGLAGSLPALTAARALLGVGQGIFVPLAIARLIAASKAEGRARALGLFMGGATVGRSTALLTVGLLLPLLGQLAATSGIAAWRWLFVLSALPNGVALFMLAQAPRAVSPPALEEAVSATAPWRLLLPAFLVAVAPVVLAQAVASWVPTLFVRARGLPAPQVALLVGAVMLVAAPAGPVLGGWLTGRYRGLERRLPVVVLGGLAITLVPLAGMVLLPSLPGAVACMVAMLLTLGGASFAGLLNVQLLIPSSARVGINGIYLAFATTVGVGAGPLLAGAMSAASGGSGAALGHALLLTGSAATIACALAVALLHRAAGPKMAARA